MKDERNNLDELFREGLGDFSPAPPPELWERIDAAVPVTGPATVSPAKGLGRIVVIGIAASVITGIALLWFFAGNKDADSPKTTEISQKELPVIKETSTSPKPGTVAGNTRRESVLTESNKDLPDKRMAELAAPAKEAIKTRAGKTEIKNSTSIGEGITPAIQSGENNSFLTPSKEINKADNSGIEELRYDFKNWLKVQPGEFLTFQKSPAFDLRYRNAFRPSSSKGNSLPLIGGIYASWDLIDYGNSHRKQSRSAGLSLSTFKGPWLLETGAAICLSNDNGRFMINYNSYDSLGYYNKVVSFSPDPDNPGTMHFNTVVQGVYDSIGHEQETKTTNRYTYLQIPLMVGYQLYASRLLSISLKAGPVFSLMLGSNEPSVTFSQEAASLQSIDNLSPARVSTNWQVAAGLGIGLHLSRGFTLQFEPTYKTYLRPVYQNNRTKPQSIGIKAGLLYRF